MPDRASPRLTSASVRIRLSAELKSPGHQASTKFCEIYPRIKELLWTSLSDVLRVLAQSKSEVGRLDIRFNHRPSAARSRSSPDPGGDLKGHSRVRCGTEASTRLPTYTSNPSMANYRIGRKRRGVTWSNNVTEGNGRLVFKSDLEFAMDKLATEVSEDGRAVGETCALLLAAVSGRVI